MRVVVFLLVSQILIFSHNADAGFKRKGLAALGGIAVAKKVSSKAYQPPNDIAHGVTSSAGNLRQPVYGTLICVEEKGSEGYGLVFHSDSRTLWFSLDSDYRYLDQSGQNYQVHTAFESDTGRGLGTQLGELDDFRDCPPDWDWMSELKSVSDILEFKSDSEIAAEQKAIEEAKKAEIARKRQEAVDAGFIVEGPHNSGAWAARAKEVRGQLEVEYPIFEEVWPALEVLIERVRDINSSPNPPLKPFDEICGNKFDKENKKKKATYSQNFGFECKSKDESWAGLLSWYHPDLKDYSASPDWSDFAYYREPQKLLFTDSEDSYTQNYSGGNKCPLPKIASKKPVSLTEIKHLDSAGCLRNPYRMVRWRIEEETIENSYHYLFDLAERFNMRVAALVTGDSVKFASASSLERAVELASTQVRRALFESIRSDEDIQNNINRYGLYPELLDLYVAMAGDESEIEDEIAAYFEVLEDVHVDTPAERAYRDFYELVAITEACYDYGKSRVLGYIDSSQYKTMQEIWSSQKKSSGLTKAEIRAVHELIDEDPSRQRVYRTIRGESYQEYWSDKCRWTYRSILEYE